MKTRIRQRTQVYGLHAEIEKLGTNLWEPRLADMVSVILASYRAPDLGALKFLSRLIRMLAIDEEFKICLNIEAP